MAEIPTLTLELSHRKARIEDCPGDKCFNRDSSIISVHGVDKLQREQFADQFGSNSTVTQGPRETQKHGNLAIFICLQDRDPTHFGGRGGPTREEGISDSKDSFFAIYFTAGIRVLQYFPKILAS